MKSYLNNAVTFVPAAKTLDFANIPNFDVRRLIAVIDQTTGDIIYASGIATKGYSSLVGTVMTLTYDTTALNAAHSLQVIYDTLGSSILLPTHTDHYIGVRPLPQQKFRSSFSRVIASGVDPTSFAMIGALGTGQAISQSAGNLVGTTGTTANADTILRSLSSFKEGVIFKWGMQLSQRIANQNFFVELVDVIGDGLAFTMNSATSISVTIPNNPFDTGNIGQSVHLGKIVGIAIGIPGKYVISAVAGNVVTFTVAGFTATGSGTLSLFGWNYHQVLYNGTTATTDTYDSARNGWSMGVTSTTFLTTVAPGHIATLVCEDSVATLFDQLGASSTAIQVTPRATRIQNVPAFDTPLFIQIRMANGSTAPASTTTMTMNFISMENYAPQAVALHTTKPQGIAHALPVQVANSPVVTGTVTTNAAAGSNLVGDSGMQYRASATGAASLRHIQAAASTNAGFAKATAGRLLGYVCMNKGATWRYLKLFNLAVAPTVGTSTPIMVIGLPPGQYVDFNCEGGIAFTTGISYAITEGIADLDTTVLTSANEVIVDLIYA